MPLDFDTSKAFRSRRAQIELVDAVRRAAVSEQETNWLEWKGTLDLSSKAAQAIIAKAVLGFSNRSPDTTRDAAGCGYLLVGVEPQSLVGVVHIDQVKLEMGVNVYAGPDVDWHAGYVEVDGKSVLVVTVEPPRWGDAIHPVRKAYQPAQKTPDELVSGAIYVRHTASTEVATPADIDMLSKRAARTPGAELEVDVQQVAGSELVRVDTSLTARSEYLVLRERSLLSWLGSERTALSTMTLMQSLFGNGEHRSEEAYRTEVHEYIEKLGGALPGLLPARSVLHDLGRVDLEILNPTDRTFTDVQVELCLPAEVGVCVADSEAKRKSKPPKPPRAYREPNPSSPLFAYSVPSIEMPYVASLWVPSLSESPDGGHLVTFRPREVRAQGRRSLTPIWLLLDESSPDRIPARWEATATGAQKRLTGSLSLSVAAQCAPPEQVMADP